MPSITECKHLGGGRFSGLSNPAIAAKRFVEATGAPFDEASFDRVAEICGDATPEQLAKGFIIKGYAELQRLCDIGDFCIYAAKDTGLITAWHASDGEMPGVIKDIRFD